MGFRKKVEHKRQNSQEGNSVPTVKAPQHLHLNLVRVPGCALSAGSMFQLGD